MISDHWFGLQLVLVIGALVSAVLAVTDRRGAAETTYLGGPESEAAHFVMNVSMAAMLAPALASRIDFSLVFLVLDVAAVALVGAGFVRNALTAQRSAFVYQLVGALAMTYAAASAVPHDRMVMGTAIATHADLVTGLEHPSTSLLAVLLAVLFGVDAIGTALVVVLSPRTFLALPPTRTSDTGTSESRGEALTDGKELTALRVAVVPHVAMGIGMIFMLVGHTSST